MGELRTVDLSDEALQDLEIWTPEQVRLRYRAVAARLLEVVNERHRAGREYAQARAAHSKAVAMCRIERKNKAHKEGHKLTSADLDALVDAHTNETLLAMDLLDEQRRGLDLEARALESVLGMLRSVGKDARQLAG